MDYNKALQTDICPLIVNEIVAKVGTNSNEWNFKVDGWKLKLAKKEYDYYKNQGLTCQAELLIDYSIYKKSGGPVRKESTSIFIPQMVKSSFVIEGKSRTHESYFDKDKDFFVSEDYLSFDGVTYRNKDKVLNIYVRGLGNKTVPLDKIDDDDAYGDPEFLDKRRLTSTQRKKIRIMYGFDPGDNLSTDAITRMIEQYQPTFRDHVVTKQLLTVDRALYQHLQKVTRKVIRTMDGQFYKNNSLYPTPLQAAVNNFFKGRSESVNPVHFPDNLNELSYLIASKKVILETGSKGDLHVSKTRYNQSFFDVVDAGVTPDNKDVNRVNELAQCVDVRSDGSMDITVLDKKTLKPVKIEFLDYMLSNVLHYQEFDYDNNKVIKSEGPYKVKFRGETKEVDSFKEVDYIDLHADERIATTSRLIPMMNSCDSVRVSMGAKMSKQAISVHKAEPPLVATGHENIKDQSPLAMTWKEDQPGEVVASDEFKGVIEVKKADGKVVKYQIPTPIYAQKRTSIQFHAAKVGTTINKGDLVYRSLNLSSDGQLQLGVNAYAAFMYWRGYDFEDSMTISENFAQRLTHLGEYQLYYDIKEGETLESLVEPGQVVSSLTRDNLITIERELILSRSQEGLKNLIQSSVVQKKLAGLKVPNNILEALVVDVKYYEVKRDVKVLDKLKSNSNKDYRLSQRSDGKLFHQKYGDYPAREIVLPDTLPRGEDKGITYRVYFKLVIASPAKEGDKITNRFGSKGVIGKVVPNAEMPRNEQGEIIDVIINPSSVIARKNLPQVAEANLSRVSTELWERIDKMSRDKSDYTKIQDILNKYHLNWLSAKSHKDFYSYHDSLRTTKNKYQIRTGSFSKYSPARVAEIMNELGLSDTEVLYDGLRGRKIKNEIQTGQVYIMKLHHMSEFQNKVTTDNPKDKNPLVLGLGETRTTGQKIGEMESVALLIHGVNDYLKEARGNTNSDWFLMNMLQSSQVVVDGKGKAMLTEVHNLGKKSPSNYK